MIEEPTSCAEMCGSVSGFRHVRQWDVCCLVLVAHLLPAQVMRRYNFFEARVPESVLVCAERRDGSSSAP